MTLLNIAQRVADEVGLPRPGSVAASSDQLARQMFALANATLEELGKMNWPELEMAYEFPTVVDQVAYDVPTDYDRFATDTAYLATQYYQVRGSLTAKEWAMRRNGMSSLTGWQRYRVFGYPPQIHFVPAPQTVQTVVIEYISKNLAVAADETRKLLFTLDTDTSVVSEELVRMGLKWRIKHAKGLDYSEDYNAYEARKSALFAQSINLGAVAVAYRSPFDDSYPYGFPYIPDTGYGA